MRAKGERCFAPTKMGSLSFMQNDHFFSSATPSLKTVLEHKKSMPQSLHYSGHIGIDEAGRGALAGPVVCAAVFFPKKYSWHTDVQDSKKLSAARRLYLAEQISLTSHYSLAFVHAGIIDSLNILQASLRGMKLVHQALSCWEKLEIPVAVDGNRTPQGLRKAYGVVGGDARILEIAAASILAKVARDQWMLQATSRYPKFAFAQHKGYPTKQHKQEIMLHGQTRLHRRSFKH